MRVGLCVREWLSGPVVSGPVGSGPVFGIANTVRKHFEILQMKIKACTRTGTMSINIEATSKFVQCPNTSVLVQIRCPRATKADATPQPKPTIRDHPTIHRRSRELSNSRVEAQKIATVLTTSTLNISASPSSLTDSRIVQR